MQFITFLNNGNHRSHISSPKSFWPHYFRRMFRRCFILGFVFFTALVFNALHAQKLYDQKLYGPYVMLFQLDAQQTEYAVQHREKLDTAFLYNHPVGKVRSDSAIPLHHPQPGNWPVKPYTDWSRYNQNYSVHGIWDIQTNGYFIELRVNAINEVQYRLIEVPYYYASVIRIGYETFIFVEDSAGLPVDDARVKLDTMSCPFDESIGGYKINRSDISGTLFVQKDGFFIYKLVQGYNSESNNAQPPRDNYQYAKIRYQGYLVTNKPKYKPGDTLLFKAFVVNKRAKPLKEKLIARMFQYNSGKSIELTLSPDPKGAYSGYFVIGDSFYTDQNLELVLLNSRRQSVISEQVYLENYELKDIEFSITTDRTLVTPGSGLKVYATATNKTGLPVMDGSITLQLSLNNVDYTDADSFVIPYKKWLDFYKITLQTDASGTTIFTIPDSIFPAMRASFNVAAVLTTSDNDIKNAGAYFNYETTRDRLESALNKDTLVVERFYNMKSVRRKMRIKYYSRNDLIADSIIYTPFQQYLLPNIYYATLFQGDTFVGSHYRTVALPEIQGKRTHDSIVITFRSAKDVPVHYRIYRNNELVASGKDTALHYHAADKSKHSYHLQYGVLAGKVTSPQFFSKSFHLKERELKVEIKQPSVIYPGQEVAVDVYVKDAWGKPVKKVNLTAYAVNTQLEGMKKPVIPYLGLEKPQKALPSHAFAVNSCNFSHSGTIRPWHFKALGLYENAVFHLVYPQKGFEVLYDTTPEHSTEIAFYNHSFGWQSPVQYVLKNDTLFSADFVTPRPGAQRIEPGKYHFQFRLFNRLVSMQNVEIKVGIKNFICLNADSADVLKMGDTMPAGQFTREEYTQLLRHTIFFRFDLWNQDTLGVKVNAKTRFGFDPYIGASQVRNIYTQKPLFNKTTGKNEYYNAQNFFVLGPVNSGDLVEFYWKHNYAHQFVFQPLQSISFTKTDAVMLPLEELNSGFQYFPKFRQDGYAFHTFWWDPDKEPQKNIYDPIPAPAESSLESLTRFEYKDYSFYDWKQSSNLNLYVPTKFSAKRIWLFCLEDSARSHLASYPSPSEYNDVGLYGYRYFQSFTLPKSKTKFILVVQNNDTTWAVKRLEIDSSVYLFLTLKENDFRNLKNSEFIAFDRMAKILGREPFAKFEDTPTFAKDLTILRQKGKNGITSLEGTVNGPDLNYVVANAFVILEKTGFFVRGAITNNDGRFLMDSLPAGDYMLKIKGANYHYWISYTLHLDAGKQHILLVKMKPYARYVYRTMLFDSDGDRIESDSYEWTFSNGAAAASPSYDYGDAAVQNYTSSEMAVAGAYDVKRKIKLTSKDISTRGSRVDGNGTFIDGQRVTGYDDEEGKYEPAPTFSGFIYNADTIQSGLLNTMASDPKARKIRREFRDHAYWVPNLQTDKKGFATYSVMFPDNITSWQTYVPAMDGKRHSGLGELLVKSYKPVSSSLALPYFLTEGDVLYSFGRIMNYTKKPVSGRYTLFLDSQGIQKNITVGDYFSDSLVVRAEKPGQILKVENGFEMTTGYRDIQTRTIPVADASVVSGKSEFFPLDKDSTLVFTGVEGDIEQTVTIYNQQLAMILEMLQGYDKILYPDNFTAADKLNALLVQKYVSQKLNIPFQKEEEIHKALRKLKNALRDDGTLGWYKNSIANKQLMAYAALVFFKAENMGFSNNGWLNIARYFEKQLPGYYGADALLALHTLKKLNREIKYTAFISRIYPKELNFSDQLKYQWLMEKLQLKGNKSLVTEHLHPSEHGDLYVAENPMEVRYIVFNDHTTNTYLAWELLLEMNVETATRKLLVSYLANSAPARWHGSILAAECLVREYEKEGRLDSALKPVISVNGKLVPSYSMPRTYVIHPKETLTIAHTGAAVYVASNRIFKTYNPVSDAKSFSISTSITGKSDSMVLYGGQAVQMKVKVLAKATQDNVVIEIPIPAGCVYDRKIQNESPYEQHREYAYDRVYIYLDQLPFGYEEFTIPLVPKFSGTFYTAPARVALMFYSDKAAFTGKKTFEIRN